MTSVPPPADEESERTSISPERGSHLKRVSLRGNALAWAIPGASISGLSLLLVTGLANTPWLFLLYPFLIGLLLVSLGMIALHLLQRL